MLSCINFGNFLGSWENPRLFGGYLNTARILDSFLFCSLRLNGLIGGGSVVSSKIDAICLMLNNGMCVDDHISRSHLCASKTCGDCPLPYPLPTCVCPCHHLKNPIWQWFASLHTHKLSQWGRWADSCVSLSLTLPLSTSLSSLPSAPCSLSSAFVISIFMSAENTHLPLSEGEWY